MENWDAIVVGVGGMGSAALYQLARRGAKVLGLESHTVGHALGSSHGQTRMIRQAYFENPHYVPLLKRAYSLWKETENTWAAPLFHQVGLALYAPEKENQILSSALASARQFEIPHELLSAEQAGGRFRYHAPTGTSCLYEPGAGYLEVENCVKAQTGLAQKKGAVLREQESVLKWEVRKDGVVVTTAKGVYQTNKLLITPGAWAPQLLPELELPMRIHRNLLYWYAGGEITSDQPCFGYETPRGFFYGFPHIEGQGLKIALHIPGDIVMDPDNLDRSLRPTDHREMLPFLKEYFPDLQSVPIAHAVCLYEMSSDENFIIDRHPDYAHVFFAAGFSGHGFKFCSVVGEILADLALEDKTAHPIEFLRTRKRL